MQTNFPIRPCLIAILLTIGAAACVKKQLEVVAVPSITGVNKALLHVGDTLVITGTGFSTTPASNQVAIATSTLTVTQASATQLSAIIQTGTQSGQLTVSLPGGRSAVWDSTIQIIGATQPYITSITPSTAYTGDTLIIRGGNFGVPSSTNDVVIGSITCELYNSTDSLLRVVLPSNAHSGALTVTTNGVTSPGVNFTVQTVNPLQDGRLYWLYGAYGYPTNITRLYRGADSAIGFPYGTVVYTNSTADEDVPPYQQMQQGYGVEPMIGDAQGNAYYLDNVYNQYAQPTTEYQVVRLSFGNGGVTHTVLQDSTWSSNSTTLAGNFPYTVNVPVAPDLLTIDATTNTLYEHIGITNTWYTANLNSATPAFVPQSGFLNDSTGFGVQFTPNYIFYSLGSSNDYYSMNLISQTRYLHRGSDTSTKVVPIPSNESILTSLNAPGHGDAILIITQTSDATPACKIYKFDPSGPTLQLLYGPNNWPDAPQTSGNWYTTGFLWVGAHIYYTDNRRSPAALYGGQSYSSLFVLNDDGSSTHIHNVYPRLEPATAQNAAYSFPLFAGKQ
ncbi:MAG TPA: IPT/TIG domain-containing protein [Puia sp.]|nr:IPT/TIG domain-containing protein [Puia sp.]